MKDIQTFSLGQLDHGYIAEELLIPENCGLFTKNGKIFHITISDDEMAIIYQMNENEDFEYLETIEFA